MSLPQRRKRGRIVVLIVDDDEGLLARTRRALLREGIDVETVTSGSQAVAASTGRPFDLVVLDLGLEELTEAELLRGIRSLDDVSVMLLCGRDAEVEEAHGPGPHIGYDGEPFGFVAFQARVRAVLRRPGGTNGLDGRLA